MTSTMSQQTSSPPSFDELLRKHARKGEPLSETVLRMLESGDLDRGKEAWPDWIGSFKGPGDLGINAEKYLGIKPWGPGEKPGEWTSGKNSG